MRNILVWLILLLLTSCNTRKQNTEILTHANNATLTCPDSIPIILAQIENPEKIESLEKADYGRLISAYHFLEGKAMADDSLILFSLQYYKTHNITKYLNDTYLLAAMYYQWEEQPDKNHELLNEGLGQSLKTRDSLNIVRFYYSLGQEQYKKKHYLPAINYYKKVISYDKKSEKDLTYEIGLAFANMGQKDSTKYYINRSIQLACSQKDTTSVYHYLRNFADILYAQSDYEEAITLLKQAATYKGYETANLYTSLSSNYLVLRKNDLAKTSLEEAKKLLSKESGQNLITTYNSIMSLQAIMDYSAGKRFDQTAIGRFNDSIWNENQREKQFIEEKIRTKTQLEQQNLKLTINAQRMQLLFVSALFLFALLGSFIYLYVQRKRRLLEEAEERLEALQTLLKKTTNNLGEKDFFFKKVLLQQLGLIRIVATTPTEHNQELLRKVSQITNNEIPVDSLLMWEDLYVTIDSVYNNFYSRLLSAYQNILIEREIQLCCMLCAEFSTKEISVVIQQSVRTIYQRKTTIRQKLNIPEKEDIVDFLWTHFC
jgi:hypothetical protein